VLSTQLKDAIVSSVTGKYSVYVLQLLSLAILSRIFTPEEFGVLAAAQVFVIFFQVVASSGLAPAIIYKERLTTVERNGIFTFTLLLGIALLFLLTSITPYIFNWYGLEFGISVFYAIGICVFFSAISMVPLASLQKDTKFLVIARCEAIAEIFSLGISIYVFKLGYITGVEALALKLILVFVFRFALYYLSSSSSELGRATFGRQISAISVIFSFFKYQLAFNFLNYFSRNLDNILIAKYFGVASLGVYEKTYQVMKYPLLLFTSAINPALQPVLTKYRNDPSLVSKEFFNIGLKLGIVGLASAFIIFWRAEEIIYVLFGDQWLAAADFLRILSISIPVQMVLSSTGALYQSFGKTKELFYCGVFSSVFNIAAIITGVYLGSIMIICLALCFSFSISFIQCFLLLRARVLVLPLRKIVLLFSLVSTGWVNIFFFEDAKSNPSDIWSALLSLSIFVFSFMCAAIAAFFIWKKFAGRLTRNQT